MPNTLESNFFQFTLQVTSASWKLQTPKDAFPALGEIHMSAAYRLGQAAFRLLETWSGAEVSEVQSSVSLHGMLRQVILRLPPDANGLRAEVTFALLEDQPIFLWRLNLHNGGSQPVQVDRLALLQTHFSQSSRQPAFFSNGWGSWNYSGAYGPQDRFRRTRLGLLSKPMRVNAGTPQPGEAGHFASDMFGVLGDRASRTALLAGFLSQAQHFGSLEIDLRQPQGSLQLWANGDGARLDPGQSLSTDWACLAAIDIDTPDPLGCYLEACWRENAKEHTTGNIPLVRSGWCSWYQYFQNLKADDIRKNLAFAVEHRRELPLDLIQIDDGFETRVGDWYTFRPGFPEGPAPLAREIQAAGFTPGLWLAPFILEPGSQLAQQHPEWLLRGKFNRPVNAGFVWNSFTTALDLTIPAALEYACQVIDVAAHQWGYPYLKLDFLYAGALPGRYHDPRQTRAQALRSGLQALRRAAGPDVFLLGCGCPLGSAIGLVEAMRIGADVAPNWKPQYQGSEIYFHAEPDYPSARNAIQNSLSRAAMHEHWWINDPDCLLVRPTAQLTLAEVQSLASVIAFNGGLMLFSDDLTTLPEERQRLLQQLLPPIAQRPQVSDWLDAGMPAHLRLDLDGPGGPWRLLALFNWQDVAQPATLRLADYHLPIQTTWVGREFWSGALYTCEAGEIRLPDLPAHGAALFAIRPASAPQYLGSDLHISQGLELTAWKPSHNGLSASLKRPGRAEGVVDLLLPQPPQKAWLENQPVTWQSLPGNCYRFAVTFEQTATLSITYRTIGEP